MSTGRFDGNLDPWSIEQGARFDRAVVLLRALTTAYTSRIARSGTDDVAELREQRAAIAAQQHDLDPADQPTIDRILREYPARLRVIRSGPP